MSDGSYCNDWKQRALDAEMKIELALSREQTMKQRAEAAEKERDSLASMSDAIQSKARAIEAENVELKKALAETREHIQKYANELCSERTENLNLKKACAEMREVLSVLKEDKSWHTYKLDSALSSTAGTGYLSPAEVKEKVRPLIEALKLADQKTVFNLPTAEAEALAYAEMEGLL